MHMVEVGAIGSVRPICCSCELACRLDPLQTAKDAITCATPHLHNNLGGFIEDARLCSWWHPQRGHSTRIARHIFLVRLFHRCRRTDITNAKTALIRKTAAETAERVKQERAEG